MAIREPDVGPTTHHPSPLAALMRCTRSIEAPYQQCPDQAYDATLAQILRTTPEESMEENIKYSGGLLIVRYQFSRRRERFDLWYWLFTSNDQ